MATSSRPYLSDHVVITDFDGTVVDMDITDLVLERFALRGWSDYNMLLEQGTISPEDCVSKQCMMVRVGSQDQITSYIGDLVKVRDGFSDLVRFCSVNDIELIVVSAGLDFCIKSVFDTNRITVPRIICPRSRLESGGIFLEFPPSFISNPLVGFKEGFVLNIKMQGKTPVFIGDGIMDYSAARHACKIFAIRNSQLERQCIRMCREHTPIMTFMPVVDFLQALSRRTAGRPCASQPRKTRS